jgi:excisionase family DNA binding protein
MDDAKQGELLRVARVAEILDVSKTWVYTLIERGSLGCVAVGRHAKRVPRKALDDFLRERFTKGSDRD